MYYNDERKQAFLKEHPSKHSVQCFRIISPFEHILKKDICEMEEEELKAIFANNFGTSQTAINNARSDINRYIKWCDKKGYSINVSLFKFNPELKDKYEITFVSCPNHLDIILQNIFPDINEYSLDNIYIAYVWLVYSGVQKSEACKILKSNIDLDECVVRYRGFEHGIYRESIKYIKRMINNTYFERNIAGSFVNKDRVESEYLFSTPNHEYLDERSFNDRLARKVKAAGYNFKLNDIYLSGVFFNKFLNEISGGGVTFNETIKEIYLDKMPESYLIARKNNDLIKGYEEWKKAFIYRYYNTESRI